MQCEQVNKHTAPELLKAWRSNSKAHPVDLYINDKRVVHMRNWLIKVMPHRNSQVGEQGVTLLSNGMSSQMGGASHLVTQAPSCAHDSMSAGAASLPNMHALGAYHLPISYARRQGCMRAKHRPSRRVAKVAHLLTLHSGV